MVNGKRAEAGSLPQQPLKVLFIYTLIDTHTRDHPLFSFQDMHIGISYVAAHLKKQGRDVRLLTLPSFDKKEGRRHLARELQDFAPAVLAFTAVSTQYPFVRMLAAHARATCPELFQVIGGTHASLCPEQVIEGPFDALCIGEGEQPLAELANQLHHGENPRNIRNMWFKNKSGEIERNPTRKFLDELDALTPPLRAMWHPWIRDPDCSSHVVLLSRGCPYGCAYCCNHALRTLASGQYVRYRDPGKIVKEIQQLKEQFPACSEIYLQAETILLDKAWLFKLCDKLKMLNEASRTPLHFACNLRVCRQSQDPEIFARLVEAGVLTIEIGLESGSESLRKRVLKRDYSNSDFVETVSLARNQGMQVNVYNMIGLPEETIADHAETIKINQQVSPDRSLTSIFYPYPGTKLHEYCQSQQLLPANMAEDMYERREASLDLPSFSKRQIQHAYRMFDWHIYKGTRSLGFRLRKTLRNYISSSPMASRAFLWALPYWLKMRNN